MGYLGHGIYVEFIPRTETVSFEIVGVPKPVNVDIDSKPVALGTLTADEEGTLHALLSTCTSLHSALSLTSTKVELESPFTPTREKTSTEDPSAHSQSNIKIDSSTPYPGDQAQQLTSNSEANTDNSHIGTAQHSVLDSASNQHKAKEMAQPTSTSDDPAQQTVVINAPDKEDNSISAELVRAIIGNQPQLVLTQIDHKDTKGDGDRTLDAKVSSNLDNILSAEQINYIMNNPPKVTLKRLSSMEIESVLKPKVKQETKSVGSVGVYLTTKSASKFRFKLSQHGIKRKYKKKYSYKCHVKGCVRKFNNVKDWNTTS